jgi:hypothetical protein
MPGIFISPIFILPYSGCISGFIWGKTARAKG